MAYPNVFSPNGFLPLLGDNIKSPKLIKRPVLGSRVATASATEVILSNYDAYTLDANGNAKHAGPNDVVYGIVSAIVLAPLPSVMNANGPLSQDQILAADAGTIIGIEDPNVLFEVQTDTFAAANRGGLFNLVDALASTLFRQSRQSLNVGGGAGVQFRAIDIVARPTDNVLGANARVFVKLAQAVA
jgi:hypothetical protein